MRPNPNRGRVYRRCACRDSNGKQLGTRCPKIANTRHGTWAFAVDLPSLDPRRKTMRRSGFATKTDAADALTKVLECERSGVRLDDTETVASYLTAWLETRSQSLKPNTVARYRDYIHNDLIPAFGAVRLERLTHDHVTHFVNAQLAVGRGAVTLRRCITTLSSALNDATRRGRRSGPVRLRRAGGGVLRGGLGCGAASRRAWCCCDDRRTRVVRPVLAGGVRSAGYPVATPRARRCGVRPGRSALAGVCVLRPVCAGSSRGSGRRP